MGHIINKIRRQQQTALLNRDAMEREQRRQQGYPTAFPMLDGQGGIRWSEADMADRELRVAMCADNYNIALQQLQALNQKMEKAGIVLPNQRQSG